MASTLPLQAGVKSNASLVKLLVSPPSFLLLLLLLLFLSLLSLLHINDLLSQYSLSRPHFLSPLLFDKQGLLSHLLHLHQHYLAFLLSPCPIFILANLIVFTLFLSVYFSSSASPPSVFVPQTFECSDASLHIAARVHALPSHDDFFLAFPPRQHFVVSQDPSEEYHVLSLDTNYYDESTYYRNVQSYSKLSKNWEKVNKGPSINAYTTSHIKNGVISQKEVKKAESFVMSEKVPSAPTIATTPAIYKVLNVDQGTVRDNGLQENRLEETASRSTKAAPCSTIGLASSQAVVINMELAPASRRTRISANTSAPEASHPPLVPLAPLPHAAKAAPTSNMPIQRPPSSPRVNKPKSLQSTGNSSKDGRSEASKPMLDEEKQALKPKKLQKKPSSIVRSNSDLRLLGQDPGTQVKPLSISPSSFAKRPQMQRAQSLRSSATSATATNVLTSSSPRKAPMMLRAQSLRGNDSSYMANPPSYGQVTRYPSFSASLEGLSDVEANKRFSDFIAHRFALMQREHD